MEHASIVVDLDGNIEAIGTTEEIAERYSAAVFIEIVEASSSVFLFFFKIAQITAFYLVLLMDTHTQSGRAIECTNSA